jgi:hypothetical protein
MIHLKKSDDFLGKVFKREEERFLNLREAAIVKSLQSYLVGIGLGAISVTGTLTALGLLSTTVLAPVGLGASIGVGCIGIGIYTYQHYQSKAKNLEKQQSFASNIAEELHQESNLSSEIRNLVRLQQHFSLTSFECQDQLIELITNDILGKSTLKEKLPKKTQARIESAENKLDKMRIFIPKESRSLFNEAMEAVKENNTESIKIIIEELFTTQILSKLQDHEDYSIDTLSSKLNKNWKKFFNKHVPIAIQQAIKKKLKDRIVVEFNKFIADEESHQSIFQTITNSRGKVTDQDLDVYANEILNSSVWPENKSLIQQILHKYMEFIHRDLNVQQELASEMIDTLKKDLEVETGLKKLFTIQQDFSLEGDVNQLIELITEEILEPPKNEKDKVAFAINKLKKNEIEIPPGSNEMFSRFIRKADSKAIKQIVQELLKNQVTTQVIKEQRQGISIEKSELNQHWKKYFKEHMHNHMSRYLEANLRRVMTEKMKNSQQELSDQKIQKSINEIVNSSIWPQGRNLVQHTLRSYIQTFENEKEETEEMEDLR